MPPKANNPSGPTRELPACKHALPARLQQNSDEPAAKKSKPTKTTKNKTYETHSNRETVVNTNGIEEREREIAGDIIDVEDESFNEITEDTANIGTEMDGDMTDEQKLGE